MFVILKYYSKILESEIILFHNKRQGFGNQFTSADLMRIIYPRKKKLIILFDQKKRHNNYIYSLFNQDCIVIKTLIEFKFFNREIKLGEYDERNNLNSLPDINFYIYPQQYILYQFLKLLININCKILSINDLYNQSWQKYKKKKQNNINIPYQHRMEVSYKYLRENNINNYKVKFSKKNKKKITKLIPKKLFKNKNKIAFYLRKRSKLNDPKDSGNFNNYVPSLKYLSKKNYLVFLIGDIENILINNKIKNIYTYRDFSISKKLYDLLFASECKYFIGTGGGGQWFGHYKKKYLLIDDFPYNNIYKEITLFKKIYKKNKILSKKDCMKKFIFKNETFFKKNKFLIKPNSSNQVKKFISNTF